MGSAGWRVESEGVGRSAEVVGCGVWREVV